MIRTAIHLGGNMKYGYLYLIGSITHGWCKVGISKNPLKRYKNLCAGLPFPLSLWDVRRTSSMEHARVLEKQVHFFFDEARLNGEWFDSDQFDLGTYFRQVNRYPNAFVGKNALKELR